MQAEEMTKELAGARYENNMARMVQNVAARKGSLKGKARKCTWRASCDPYFNTIIQMGVIKRGTNSMQWKLLSMKSAI